MESLARQKLELMNVGESLDLILHSVSASKDVLAKPYLLPKYNHSSGQAATVEAGLFRVVCSRTRRLSIDGAQLYD